MQVRVNIPQEVFESEILPILEESLELIDVRGNEFWVEFSEDTVKEIFRVI